MGSREGLSCDADLIDERREEFARGLSLEQGKPYAAEALGDIDETAENFRIAAEDVKRLETAIFPSQDVGKRILTFRKPNGVYAGITPWNFPTLIPVERQGRERRARRGACRRAARDASRRRLCGLRRLTRDSGKDRPRRRAEALADRSERQRAGDRLRGRRPGAPP
jgi:hypothetical protein